MKEFLFIRKGIIYYNLVWYFEEIRQEYYTRWNNTVMGKETTFRIVR